MNIILHIQNHYFDDNLKYHIGPSNPPPNLHVGGVKMRERNKRPEGLMRGPSIKYSDPKCSDNDEKNNK